VSPANSFIHAIVTGPRRRAPCLPLGSKSGAGGGQNHSGRQSSDTKKKKRETLYVFHSASTIIYGAAVENALVIPRFFANFSLFRYAYGG
jgi:hypothetical protein